MPQYRWSVLLLWLCALPAWAEVNVVDALGNRVHLERPAQRIISLAPHTTELLFAAGAGSRVVGTVAYSNYPAAARTIPQVGGYQSLDLERIISLKPDLVVAWSSGNGAALIEQLRTLGITVYVSEPRRFEDIATSLEQLGELTGSEDGAVAARQFRRRRQQLAQRYQQQPLLSVFYQIWNQPLMTVNGEHLISRVIALCGGENIFAGLATLTPSITVEAVLNANPQVIVASGMGEARPEWLDDWRHWPQLRAAKAGHLIFIPPDLLQRPTPRLLDGAEQLCQALEKARQVEGSIP